MSPEKAQDDRKQVVYLFGAGASQACVKAAGYPYGILMQDLAEPLRGRIHDLVSDDYDADPALTELVNTVITEDADFEHIITFLDQSTSDLHRRFADDLRRVFEEVLSLQLARIEHEAGEPPVTLYEAVLDLHDVEGFGEQLRGILTLNYDPYIELAIQNADRAVDFGLDFEQEDERLAYRLLKLHGSFGWGYSWPVAIRAEPLAPLWIPPGIQKVKGEYPFNLLWGRARELLDCDVLRIVGCHIGPNDWDLISLLFTTRHTNARKPKGYRIEIINSPENALRLRREYPYLDVRSIYETEPVGSRLISELLGGEERPYGSLTPEERDRLHERGSRPENWFHLWLVHMAEASHQSLGSIETPRGILRGLMEAS